MGNERQDGRDARPTEEKNLRTGHLLLTRTVLPRYTQAMNSEPRPSRPAANLQEELGKRHPFEMAEEEAYLNLARTAEHLTGPVRAVMVEHGLSEPLYNALRIVAGHGDAGLPSQSIADDMVCRNPDVTKLVDRLCKLGLVRRQRSTQDRRVICVHITAKGQAMLQKMKKPLAEVLSSLFTGLKKKELAQLNDLLFRARQES